MWIAVGCKASSRRAPRRTWGWAGVLLAAAGAVAAHAQFLATTNAPRIGLRAAVETTLKRDPNIKIQEEQIKFSEGTVLREAGLFDFTLDAAASYGVIRTPRTELERLSIAGRTNEVDTVSDVSNQRAAVTKQFRGGPSVSTGVEFNRFHDNLSGEAINRGNVNFVLNVPLLKGLGTAATGAGEKAARVLGEAAALEYGFVAGQRVLNTAVAYWECLGAEANLQTFTSSAARSSNLLERVKQLVSAGEIPAAELRQTEADVAQKTAEMKAAQQRFFAARQNFGLALGLAGKELDEVPLPEARWPLVETNQVAPNFTGQPVVERSLNRRADYQAAKKNQEAAEILEKAARLNLKPQLDLTMELGYAGLAEGSSYSQFYSSIDPRPVNGPNAIGTLRFIYPIGNKSARGLLAQREALRQQTVLREENLARGIGSAIMVAFSDLEQSSQEVLRAREAVALYQTTVSNEREKLRIGNSTIVDVITIADRLDFAETRATDALVRYAVALAKIRYETGLLIARNDREATVSMDDFMTLPSQSALETLELPAPKFNRSKP